MSTSKVVHVDFASLKPKNNSINFPSYDFDYIKLSFNVTGNIAAPYTTEVILPKDHSSTFYLPVMSDINLSETNNLMNLRVTFSVTGNTFTLSCESNGQLRNPLYVTLSYCKY